MSKELCFQKKNGELDVWGGLALPRFSGGEVLGESMGKKERGGGKEISHRGGGPKPGQFGPLPL